MGNSKIKSVSNTWKEYSYEGRSRQLLFDSEFQELYLKTVAKYPHSSFLIASEQSIKSIEKELGYYHWRFISIAQQRIIKTLPIIQKKLNKERALLKKETKKRMIQEEKRKKIQEEKRKRGSLDNLTK